MPAKIICMTQQRTIRELATRATDTAAIGRRLAAAREAVGLRQVDLAELSGVARNTLAQWESGAFRPSLDQVVRLLPVLGVDLDWIYLGDDRGLPFHVRQALMEADQRLERRQAAQKVRRATP